MSLPRVPEAATTTLLRPAAARQLLRGAVNLVGAASAAYFAYSFVIAYVDSHRPIGLILFAHQALVAVAYLVRRPPRRVTRRLDDWLLAFTGTFVGVLFRPDGAYPAWGAWTGTALQVAGVAIAIIALVGLGRSFGFAAADRGVVTRGAYAVVRHPMYASYLLLESGYFVQSLSLRNALVLVVGTLCNCGRALAEERLLTNNEDYRTYRQRVPHRMVPGLW